jgi:general secretion pathway protein C
VSPFLDPVETPEPPPPPAATAQDATAEPINPFRSTALAAAPAEAATPVAAETNLALQLHGTWVDEEGGSAIIQLPEGPQKAFRVGDDICCGAQLVEVYPDQVIISRAGARESLRLPNRLDAPTPAPPPAATPSGAQQGAAQPAPNFTQIARIDPIDLPAGGVGYRLFPGDNPQAFLAAGLQAGDVILAINDQPPPSDPAEIVQLLDAPGSTASLVVERDGEEVALEIRMADLKAQMGQ